MTYTHPDQTNPERYRAMVESAIDFAIFSLDPAGTITTWNTGAERMFGFSRTEAVGRPGSMIFTAEDLAEHAPSRELSIAATENRARDDRWHVRRDSSRFWASGLMMPLRDESGIITGFVKVVEDRTSEKRLEESLRHSEEQFARVFLRNAAAIAVELRANGRFVLANEEFFALTGFWRAEAMGRSGDDLHIWADPGQRSAALGEITRSGRATSRIDIIAKSGERRPCVAAFQSTLLDEEECLVVTYVHAAGLVP